MGYVLKTVPGGQIGFRIEKESGEPVEEANRFLQTLWGRALSTHTVRAYGYGLVVLYRWMESSARKVQSLTNDDLMSWILLQRERGANAHTINHRLLICRLYYRFLTGHDMPTSTGPAARQFASRMVDHRLGQVRLRRSHAGRASWVKTEHRLIEPLSASQVNGFLATVSRYRDIAIILLMLFCGLRSMEVRNLGLADIGFLENMLRVRGKGNRERALPLPEPVASAIRKYLHLERPPECPSDRLFVVLRGKRRGQPMTSAGLRSLFRVRRRRQPDLVGLANPHRFRHTFGADMARAGVRLPVLQRMMGHASGLTTLRYIQLSVTDIAQEYGRAMERIGERYGGRFPS